MDKEKLLNLEGEEKEMVEEETIKSVSEPNSVSDFTSGKGCKTKIGEPDANIYTGDNIEKGDGELTNSAVNVTEELTPEDLVDELDANDRKPSESIGEAPIENEGNVEGGIEPTPAVEPTVTSTEEHESPIVEENGAYETSIKTFTQDDVDKLVGDTRVKTREKTFRYIYDRYGVKDEEELDALISNAQRYDTQKEMYEADKNAWETEKSESDKKLSEMSETIALMQSGIDSNRYEDAKLILKGKGLEVNLDNINNELASHPEWKKEEAVKEESKLEEEVPTVSTRIKTLGNEPKPVPQESEEEQAEKLFKMKFHG